MEFLIVVAIGLILLIWWGKHKAAQEHERRVEAARQQRIFEIQQIASSVQGLYEKMAEAKTAATRSSRAQKALDTLKQVTAYPEYRDVIRDYDKKAQHLEAITRVSPVIAAVEKAYRHKFKGSQKPELNALLDALYEIKKNAVTNDDIRNARIMPEGTGEIVAIEDIERRCRELGWDG
ncbi:hypothetical protein QAO71_10580 [Halopseudomonas sp. SMJS2]|uniref:hypothetical protein n=1 Tax=Halopseudomonas sp. SMJS2 TaxID=3041098 RepID=UPI00245297E4|nr:hypothetical protein [Halopseudomonas sp. SMJS2]WGK60538.1 hypothetical protein QAO71_10580 [Halopseudomonas sp. SMJS2]